jgi:UDP-glucose 6-dehydrogenase
VAELLQRGTPDVRNTKIVDVIAALIDAGITVTIYDPLVEAPVF